MAQYKNIIKARKEIEEIVFSHKEILQMYGFYLDAEQKSINSDIIIDFKADSQENIYQHD